jgi:hypothetical protein
MLIILLGSLRSEVGEMLEVYSFNGYTIQWSRGLYLSIGEPCTLWTFPGEMLQGVVAATGGDSVLSLRLELTGTGMNTTVEGPDDLPVIEFSTGEEQSPTVVVIEALDMLFGATSDSAYVFIALRHENEVLDPAMPDSAIQGE